MSAIHDALLRKARRSAEAARADGLAEKGPARVAVAIQVIDLVTAATSTSLDSADVAFLKLILSASQQQLQLAATIRRKGA